MKKPSEMPREIDIFFFRENEIPMWEVRPFDIITCIGMSIWWNMDHKDKERGQREQNVGVTTFGTDW